MSFPRPLQMQHIPKTSLYFLISLLVWIDPDGKRWELEPGTKSDGHSYPPPLRSITGGPFATKFPIASWFHDEWCRSGIIPRREADRKYLLIMKEEGASKYEQIRNFTGVRIGAFFKGLIFWRRREKDTN